MTQFANKIDKTQNFMTINDLKLPNNDVDLLQKFFGLMHEDEGILCDAGKAIEKTLDELIESFYRDLSSVPDTKQFFADSNAIDRSKRATCKYLQELTAGDYSESFVNERLSGGSCLVIGELGLQPYWWLGLYSRLLQSIFRELHVRYEKEPEKLATTFLSFTKVLFFDLALRVESLMAKGQTKQPSTESESTDNRLQEQNLKIGELIKVLAEASGRVSTVANQLSSSTTQALSTVSETTATAEEVRQVAEQTSSKAKDVSDDAKSVVQVSRQGQEATDATVQGMVRIREQMDSIAECMVQLGDQSKLIGEIIATVDDLAQQSNLLAVNASIEAAKAGEQGKGFAVVAQEVKNLSQQSKTATAHVRNILNDIMKATTDATLATEQGGKAVEAGHLQATNAGQVIRRLTDSIEKASEATDIIEVASQQQLLGMKQMVEAMEGIKQASEQNTIIAEQLEESAKELNDLGQEFRQLSAKNDQISDQSTT